MLKYDVFICHASDDKTDIATPLAIELKKYRLEVWYDDFILIVGDNLEKIINDGLEKSRYGIVILSNNFFAKFLERKWPKREFDALTSNEKNGKKVILPVRHNLTMDEVKTYSSHLANLYVLCSSEGIPTLTEKLIRVIDDGVYLDKPDTISIGTLLKTSNTLSMILDRPEERGNYWEITLNSNAQNNIISFPALKVVFYTFPSVSPAKKRYPDAKNEDAQKIESRGKCLRITDVGEESYGYNWQGAEKGIRWVNGVVIFRRYNLMVRTERICTVIGQGKQSIDRTEQLSIDEAEKYAQLVDLKILDAMRAKGVQI